jgi:hypothetical protein
VKKYLVLEREVDGKKERMKILAEDFNADYWKYGWVQISEYYE